MMSLWNWLGRKIRLTDGKFWSTYLGTETWAGKPVTPETALQVATFWSCVRLISQTIGTLPLGLYERQEDGGREARSDHPLYTVLHDQPNADQTAVEFWEGLAAGLCIWGNGFAEKNETSAGVVGLRTMPPDQTTVFRNNDGDLRYRFFDRGKTEELPEKKVFHVRAFGLGGDVGLSPLAYARQTLGASMATDEASARTFSNGMRPSGWLLYKGGNPTPEQRKQIHDTLIAPMEGSENAGKIGILPSDIFDYRQMTIPPEDAQMLETRGFHVEELCRWLGVPPVLVGHSSPGQTMFGAGVEQIMIGWLTLGLRPYLTRIEQAIKRSLIKPGERSRIYAEFTVEGLLRGDSAARAAFLSTMVQNGLMTRDEGRALDNRPRLPGGNMLTVQSNLVPLDRLGELGGQPSSIPVGAGSTRSATVLELVRNQDLK